MVATYSVADSAGNYEPVYSLDLRQGDGVCMGVHGWLEGVTSGNDPVATTRET